MTLDDLLKDKEKLKKNYLTIKESEIVKRTHSSQRNGLIFSCKKDRQCFSALPILFLYISQRSLRECQGQGKCSARTTPCPNGLVVSSFAPGKNKYS